MLFLVFSFACFWVRAYQNSAENGFLDTTLYRTTTTSFVLTPGLLTMTTTTLETTTSETTSTTDSLTRTTTLETASSKSPCDCDCVSGCEWESFSIDGKVEYFKNIGRYHLYQAERACQELSAKLPLPENKKQNTDMLRAFRKMIYRLDWYNGWILIGLKEKEGNWVKPNGENVTYFNWAKKKPNNALDGQNFAIFQTSPAIGRQGKWNIRGDSLPFYYRIICQRIGKLVLPFDNSNFINFYFR